MHLPEECLQHGQQASAVLLTIKRIRDHVTNQYTCIVIVSSVVIDFSIEDTYVGGMQRGTIGLISHEDGLSKVD